MSRKTGTKPGVMLYFTMADSFRSMSDSDAGRLIKAVFSYAEAREEPVFNDGLSFAWAFVKPVLDADDDNYTEKCTSNAYAAYVKHEKAADRKPLSRDEWKKLRMDADACECMQMDADAPNTNECMQMDANVTNTVQYNTLQDSTIQLQSSTVKSISEHSSVADCFSEFACGDSALLQALHDFSEMRNARKKPLTAAGKREIIASLQKYPQAQWIALLNQSIRKSWLDIYPLKNDSAPKQTKPKVEYGSGELGKAELDAIQRMLNDPSYSEV